MVEKGANVGTFERTSGVLNRGWLVAVLRAAVLAGAELKSPSKIRMSNIVHWL